MSAELRQLIRDAASSMPSDATPPEIAGVVVAGSRDELVSKFLTELVTAYAYNLLASDRSGALNSSHGSNRSAKLERRRSWWARTLETRVAVGENTWKRLGDCTIDDLQACIAERLTLIEQIRHQIGNYQTIIAAMREHKARVVAELSAEQVDL